MAVSATKVRELREMTGAAMMDCKKALEASGGDMEAAVDHLRKQGLKTAAKKTSRSTGEGRVFAAIAGDGRRGHLVGVACETDFLASSAQFIGWVDQLAEHVAAQDPDGLEHGQRPLLPQSWKGAGPTVSEAMQEAIGQFRENIRITDLVRMENSRGYVVAYVHHDKKKGAIVSVTTTAAAEEAEPALRSLCQHVVVHSPAYRTRSEVDAETLEREKAVLRESDDLKSKPAEMRDKIVEGRLGKFYSTSVLEEQPWILDDKTSVQKALERELGKGARIEAFARVQIGT
jgi:elongation factor Ts